MGELFRLDDEYRRIVAENPSIELRDSNWVKRYSGLIEYAETGEILYFPHLPRIDRAVKVMLQRQRLEHERRRRIARLPTPRSCKEMSQY